MACSYDPTTDRGKVRLIIGDTSTTACIFSDAEIDIFLSMNSGSINLAAADALAAWAAKYTLLPETEKIGDYSYANDVVKKMNKLQMELREKDAKSPVLEWSEIDLSGGSYITEEGD